MQLLLVFTGRKNISFSMIRFIEKLLYFRPVGKSKNKEEGDKKETMEE